MSGRVTVLAGVVTVLASVSVLLAWAAGATMPVRLVSGWRVIVPSTAFGFLVLGVGLTIASTLDRQRAGAVVAVRLLALVALIAEFLTLVEYFLGVRSGVESWFGISFAANPRAPAGCRR